MSGTVSILPPAETQFCDANGAPLAGGSVTTYTPGTTTPSTTWQDSAGTVPNENPLTLDAAGRAIIWGSGSYRMVVKDVSGNLIYDQVTFATSLYATGAYVVDSGPANALAITLTPAPTSLASLVGVPLRVKVATANTGTATLNVNGLGATAITNLNLSALVPGQLSAGSIVSAVYDGAQFQLASGNDLFVGTSKILNSYGTAGTFPFTVPANIYQIYTECTAGGGGGGYGAASNFGSGGGGGGWGAKSIAVTPGQTIAIVVGAAGTGGTSGAAATNGGASSVGAVLSCTGGGAGISNGVNPGGGGVPSGSDFGFAGGTGQGGFAANASTWLGGAGGGVPRTAMGTNYAANGAGNGPNAAGAGGGAGANGNNGAAGAPGQVLIFAG